MNNTGETNIESIEPTIFCGICGDDYCKSIKYTLPCKHSFHYDCLISTFVHSGRKYNHSCPYCRQKCGYLNVPENRTPIKYINSDTNINIKYKCVAIIKSGKRKGLECGCNVYPSYVLCKRHLKS